MDIKDLMVNLKNKFNAEKVVFYQPENKIEVTINGATYVKTYAFGEPLESIIDFINNNLVRN
jgi:hypothetical protein